MVRFILYVFMAFTTAFVGVLWAARGFPTRSSAPPLVAPLRPTLDSRFGDENAAKASERKQWVSEHTAQSDKNPKLDALRLDALQAANAYSMSPCDRTMKSNLIDAATAYTRAWQAKLGCKRTMLGMMSCSEKQITEAADTFSTPLDDRVKAALRAAFNQKGVIKADFPDDVRVDVLYFAGPGLAHDESPICLPSQLSSAEPVQ
jgi:hypothetical protein